MKVGEKTMKSTEKNWEKGGGGGGNIWVVQTAH